MKRFLIPALAAVASGTMAAAAIAQSGSGVSYGSEECRNDPAYLTENDIACTAVFASTDTWDFLNNLPRRITLDEMNELNPELGEVTYETVIEGITFVRVR